MASAVPTPEVCFRRVSVPPHPDDTAKLITYLINSERGCYLVVESGRRVSCAQVPEEMAMDLIAPYLEHAEDSRVGSAPLDMR